jgi:hypothetical protein
MVKIDTGEATINNLAIPSMILGMQLSADAINNTVIGYLNDIPAAAAMWDSSFNITKLAVLKAYEGWGLGKDIVIK